MGAYTHNDDYETIESLGLNVRRFAIPDTTVLLHDGGGDRSQTVEAVRELLR